MLVFSGGGGTLPKTNILRAWKPLVVKMTISFGKGYVSFRVYQKHPNSTQSKQGVME